MLVNPRTRSGLKTVICLLMFVPVLSAAGSPQPLDVETIIQKSVRANQLDFDAAPDYAYDERDKTDQGTKTYRVLMIDGSPYKRLIAIDGKALPPDQAEHQMRLQRQEAAKRSAETATQRKKRIASYCKDRERDHDLLDQIAKAFDFRLIGERNLDGFDVYYLKATPRPGYKPSSINTQVLTGMTGFLWIDKDTFQWVKVTAKVTKPVSIQGFLAQVEAGTRFELEKMPVGNGVWLAKHFAMHSRAKVLFIFNHSSSEEEWYSKYKRTGGSDISASLR